MQSNFETLQVGNFVTHLGSHVTFLSFELNIYIFFFQQQGLKFKLQSKQADWIKRFLNPKQKVVIDSLEAKLLR